MANNTNIKAFSLINCGIDDGSISKIADGLAENNSVATVNFSNNLITDEGLNSLLPALQYITSLNLS